MLSLFPLLFFFFASWSAVTMLPCPLGSACRENPNIVENMKYLWTSSVAHLDMGEWGEIWNFHQSKAPSPPLVSGSICSIMGSSFPELPWSRSGLASSSSPIFNISNIFPARAPATAVCFKSTNYSDATQGMNGLSRVKSSEHRHPYLIRKVTKQRHCPCSQTWSEHQRNGREEGGRASLEPQGHPRHGSRACPGGLWDRRERSGTLCKYLEGCSHARWVWTQGNPLLEGAQ